MSNYTSKHSAGGSRSGKSGNNDSSKKTQKILIIVIICVLAVIIAAALIFIFVPGAESGVSNLFGGKTGGYVPETQSVTTNITPYYNDGILPTSSDRHDIDIIYGGGENGSDLYGTWKMNDHDTYKFDGLGRGVFLAVDKDGSIPFKFTFVYSAQDGKLGIDYDGNNGEDRFYDYTIDGDTMTWTFNGNTYTLEKVADQ